MVTQTFITFSQVVQNQNTCGSWYYDTTEQGKAIALFKSCLGTQGYSSISAQGADIDYSAESVLYTVI